MNSILKIMPAILKDTLTDSLKMLPFLFVAYLFIEYLEHRHSAAMEKVLSGGGKYGFFSGALLGIVPQCGFSAMAANLYSSNVITAGTLISVFLATSDEAVPLLVAEPSFWPQMLLLLVLKFFFAVIGGFLVDNVLKKVLPRPICGGYEGRMEEIDCHEHREKEGIFKAAVRHTLHIFIFIVIFIFLLDFIMDAGGTSVLSGFLNQSGVLQVFASGLVGMVPNCAASVLITQMFIRGELSFAGLFAGLCTGAGIGPLVLIRTIRNKKQAAMILVLEYILGTAAGLCVLAFMH